MQVRKMKYLSDMSTTDKIDDCMFALKDAETFFTEFKATLSKIRSLSEELHRELRQMNADPGNSYCPVQRSIKLAEGIIDETA